MSTIGEILKQQGESVIKDLRKSFETNKVNASGNLSRSLMQEIEINQVFTRLTVSAASYVFTTEEGRGPTKGRGDGELYRRILQWIEDKKLNIPDKQKRGVAFAITKTIHEKGTRLFRSGSLSGVLSNVLNDQRVNEILEAIGQQQEESIIESIIRTTKENVA